MISRNDNTKDGEHRDGADGVTGQSNEHRHKHVPSECVAVS